MWRPSPSTPCAPVRTGADRKHTRIQAGFHFRKLGTQLCHPKILFVCLSTREVSSPRTALGGAAPDGSAEDLQDLCGAQYNEADGFAVFEAVMSQILDLSAIEVVGSLSKLVFVWSFSVSAVF